MGLEGEPISALLGASATAVGVGMILGGFVAGLVGLVRGGDRDEVERRVVDVGYVAAAFCLVVRLAEMVQTI